jgi:rhomboid protease GluP
LVVLVTVACVLGSGEPLAGSSHCPMRCLKSRKSYKRRHRSGFRVVRERCRGLRGLRLCFNLIDGRESNMSDGMNFGEQEPVVEEAGMREHRQQVDFQRAFAAAPSPVVTYGLIAINLLVYVAMVAKGVSPMQPTPSQVLPWGANFGPLTLQGQWWRLITACFLHFGLIHVGMNMFILFQVGVFAEKLFGNGRYLLLYLLAGVGGNIAGLYIHPLGVAAGASGAVFGVYGGLLGFLLIQRGVVPTSNSLAIAKSAGIFLVYNLIYGLSSKTTDLTAHIGGLITGFVVGCALARPLSSEGQRLYPFRTLTVGVLGVAAAYLAMARVPRGEMPDGQWYWRIHFGPSVTVGQDDRVAYAGSATMSDADRLAHALLDAGFFHNPDVVVLLTKNASETSVSIPIWKAYEGAGGEKAPWDDPEFLSGIRTFGIEIAPSVGGPPIQMQLVDSKGNLKKSVVVEERQVTVGTKDKVWYTGAATLQQAQALGQALLAQGFFRDRGAVASLSKENGETHVALMVREGAWNEPKMIPVFEGIGRSVAGAVGGLPIHLELLNQYAQPQKELLVE